MKTAFAIIASSCLCLPMAGSAQQAADQHRFGVNNQAILCPPSSEMDPELIPYNEESTDLVVGPGRTPGFGFLFNTKVLDSHLGIGMFRTLPGFEDHPYVNKLSGSVGFLSVADSKRFGPAMRARDLSDEWTEDGRCGGRVVSRIGRSELFEVKCSAADDYANVLNRRPQKGETIPDPNSVVVATCTFETISVGKFAGQSLRSCTRVVILEKFIVNYRIQEKNLPLYRQIDDFLRGRIVGWKNRCVTR